MNQHLETLFELIQKSKQLSADEKKISTQALMNANEELQTKSRDRKSVV